MLVSWRAPSASARSDSAPPKPFCMTNPRTPPSPLPRRRSAGAKSKSSQTPSNQSRTNGNWCGAWHARRSTPPSGGRAARRARAVPPELATLTLETTINGRPVALEIEPRAILLDVLRDRLGLTGAKRSCDTQVCGACTVLLDGAPVSACCTLAYEAHGRAVET